jgi:hypothetical protein
VTRKIQTANGEWVDGKAKLEHLPERLRVLPSDLVTKDIDDPDRIHADDVPHIRKALIYEEQNRLTGRMNDVRVRWGEANTIHPKIEKWLNGPVTWQGVALIRTRILRVMALGQMDRIQGHLETDLSVKHVWFPENRASMYELRDGNPPADQDRPKYLRGIDLSLDLRSNALPGGLADIMRDEYVTIDDLLGSFNKQTEASANESTVPK